MVEGFIAIPRALEYDSAWMQYSLKERAFFLYILSHCVFKPYEYSLKGKNILLKPGQIIFSYQSITDDFNQTLKYQSDMLPDKKTAYRIIEKFTRDQKVTLETPRHLGRSLTLLTISDPMIYNCTFKDNATANATANATNSPRTRHDIKRTTNEKDDNDAYTKSDTNEDVRPTVSVFADSSFMHEDNSSFSSPSAEEDLFAFAKNYRFPDNNSINDYVLMRWWKDYGDNEVAEAIKYYDYMKTREFIRKPEAYIESTLKSRHWENHKMREFARKKDKEHEQRLRDSI